MQLRSIPEHFPAVCEPAGRPGCQRRILSLDPAPLSSRLSLGSLEGCQFGVVGLKWSGPPRRTGGGNYHRWCSWGLGDRHLSAIVADDLAEESPKLPLPYHGGEGGWDRAGRRRKEIQLHHRPPRAEVDPSLLK